MEWASGAVVQGDGPVTNLEFHNEGNYMVMSTSNNTIHLVDVLSGAEKKKVFVKSTGVGILQYTHHDMCVVMSSADKRDFDVRYLCLYDNRFLRQFRGHTNEIVSLSMNPVNDQFMSSSKDGSVLFWDLSSQSAVGKLSLPGQYNPYCSYDAAGLVFGVLCQDRGRPSSLKLFDARNYNSGPFANICPSADVFEKSLKLNCDPSTISRLMNSQWTGFEFSADGGNSVLINTESEALFILDGFKATTVPKAILSRKNDSGSKLAATFSADSRHIVTSNEDNELLIYDRTTAELKHTLTGHVAPIGSIRCNKVHEVIASGCVNTILWIKPSAMG